MVQHTEIDSSGGGSGVATLEQYKENFLQTYGKEAYITRFGLDDWEANYGDDQLDARDEGNENGGGGSEDGSRKRWNGFYDVLGYPELNYSPHIFSQQIGLHPNIDDPSWVTGKYPEGGEHNWSTDPLNFYLPPVPQGPKSCEEICVLKQRKRVTACNALRKRVQMALDRAGCPCDIIGKDKPSPCRF